MRRKLGLLVILALVAAAWSVGATARAGQAKTAPKAAAKTGQATPGGHAAIEQTLVSNERAINEAVTKGDAATFRSLVAPDSWSIDPMGGRMSTADFLKQFDQMAKDLKMTSWDISDPRTFWIDPNTAVVTYKWSGQGTYQGQPVPSPVWASTVWSRQGGKWQARFHQESPAAPQAK